MSSARGDHGDHGDRGDAAPRLEVSHVDERTRAVALLLHGGAEVGVDPVSAWAGPPLRMIPFGCAIRRRVPHVGVARLRFRRRGWNGSDADPVADVEYALARIAERHRTPVVLVGHSMGGRAAIRAAGDPHVLGVVALAPWLPAGEPVEPLRDKPLVVVHGSADRRTSPIRSADFARAVAGIARSAQFVEVDGGDHAMLRRWSTWHRRTAAAVAEIVDGA